MSLKKEIDSQGGGKLLIEISDVPIYPSVQIDDKAGLDDIDVTWSADKLSRELDGKVDKVDGHSLVADDEITKLSTVEQDAQKNTVNSVAGRQGDVLLNKEDVGLDEVDNTSDADKPVSTAVADELDKKVDKVPGKGLSDTNFTQDEKDKLSDLPSNQDLAGVLSDKADKTTQVVAGTGLSGGGTLESDRTLSVDYGTTAGTAAQGDDPRIVGAAQKTYVDDELDKKVDKVSGKQLSDENFTQTEKDKLSGIDLEATKNRADSENADKVHTHTINQVDGLDDKLDKKVDKVAGKQLSEANFTQAEKDKLLLIQAGAQVNAVDSVAGKVGDVVLNKADIGLINVDNTSDADKPISYPTQAALDNKVDKVSGKQLSDENFNQYEKAKLATIASEATKNRDDSLNADKVHTHTTDEVIGLDAALNAKVDKVAGKQLSDENFTQAEKDKLSSLESSKFIGLFVSESALPVTGSEGNYANVDGGVGNDVYRVIWDTSDNKWVRVQGATGDLTPAQIKQQYESNPDTNAFTNDEKSKLAGVDVGATANRSDSENADKVHTHTTDQVIGLDAALDDKVDKVGSKQLSDENYTLDEKNKLDGIASEATKNRPDSQNADKVHTHAIDQVTGLDDALDNKVDKVSGKQLSDENYTQSEKNKLDGIASEATKNRSDSENADKVHTHTTAQVDGLDDALDNKVDKVSGKQLSDENFTQSEKSKLSELPTNQTLTGLLEDKVDKETGKGLIEPAPVDGKQYARKDNTWVEVSGGTGDVEEAPMDGAIYGRYNGEWVSLDYLTPYEIDGGDAFTTPIITFDGGHA